MRNTIAITFVCVLLACQDQKKHQLFGSIEVFDKSLTSILDTTAIIEIIATGHEWTEGPLWVEKENCLLYSDIPRNKIYKWTAQDGAQVYLDSAGYTGSKPRGGELGSNGLLLNAKGQLVLCQHGNRQMALMEAPLQSPKPQFTSLAANFEGKRFNSPNDATFRSNGDLFFTDPPYGLEGYVDDPGKELPYQGVFKLANGRVDLLTDTITRPNGIALINQEKTLLVANSDGPKAFWYLYDLGINDSLTNPRLLMDARPYQREGVKGGPDGLKVDAQGNIFATGPGGVFIFNSAGKLLGRLKVPEACSNVALTPDGKTIFITADMYVLKLVMRQ
jgi:gluconolactonase